MNQSNQIIPTVDQLDHLLNEIRPHLETDGGDIKVLNITDDFVVEVELLGNCQACNLSGMTLKNGVEAIIRSHYPMVKEVIEIKTANS